LGGGNQGCLLRMQALGLRVGGAPASTIPDINGLEWRGVLDLGVNVLRKALEQGGLLATGNQDIIAGAQMLGGNTQFLAAQLINCNRLLSACGFAQSL
jgi:hypothetical protein